MVADSVNLLLDYPAGLAANEIKAWTAAQFRSAQPSPVSDYLYHAFAKIHALGQYSLVPKDPLHRYLAELEPHVMALCPPEDRQLLAQNLGRLGKTDSVLPPVEILRRDESLRTGDTRAARDADPGSRRTATHMRELSLLIGRLSPLLATPPAQGRAGSGGGAGGVAPGREAGSAAAEAGAALVAGAAAAALPDAGAERRDVLLSQILSVAAMAARTDGELRGALDQLRSVGVDIPTAELFRALSRSVPQWPASSPTEPLEQALTAGKGAPTAAMRRVVTLSGDPDETGRRFSEMLNAAVEQLNQGSVARAVRMIDVAARIIAEKGVEPAMAESARRRAQETVDLDRVRSLGEDSRNHEPLARILSFFPSLTSAALIDDLHGEEKRERRRLLLSLLEIHGAGARATALGMLAESRPGDPAHDWHFKRNLLYLLRRVPRATNEPSGAELDVLVALANPSLPAPLLKEAIAGLGAARHERSEAALTSLVQKLESTLVKKGDAPVDQVEQQSLLDRAVSALARFGSRTSRRVVVEHGLRRRSGLGNAGARLAELAGQDLSNDPELVGVLLASLKADLPFKVFGLSLKRRDDKLSAIIDALSSTPLPQVKVALQEVVDRHAETGFAKAAARVLAAFGALRSDEHAAAASLSGDLALFELPSLLQSFEASKVTGALTIRNASGAVIGRLLLDSGRIRSAESGALKGDEACYQLFERPCAGTFAFAKQAGLPSAEGEPPPREVVPLLIEGMRRYEELQRFTALVPDDTVLRLTGSRPTAEPEETDHAFQQTAWAKAVAGLSARAIEAVVVADPFRIRRLLARWVGDGSLEPA